MCDLCQLSALDVSAVKLLAQDAAPSDPHQLVHHAPSQVVPRAMSVHRPAPPQVGNCPGQVQDGGGGGNDGGEGLGGGDGDGGGGEGEGGGGEGAGAGGEGAGGEGEGAGGEGDGGGGEGKLGELASQQVFSHLLR